MAEIAIVGGGPSGAMCGEQLACAGHKVNLFDEHLAWEKPCGGGLTHKAIQCFPFLLDNSYPKKLVHSVQLISSEEHQATLEMPQGYFVPQTADAITIKFLPHFEGYIWSFPRCDHLSVGICGSMSSHTSTELRSHLNAFVEKHGIPTDGAKFYSHVLPSPKERTLSERNVVGKNWALVGDAAAWVDPLTGEGLFYAIRSGELLGRSLAEGCPEKYPAWIKATFSAELEFAARIVRRFYRGSFLGSAVTTRMVQFIRRSPVFRQLMGDLFSGTQDYSSLKRRLWGHLGITISEFIASVLNLDSPASARVPGAGTAGD